MTARKGGRIPADGRPLKSSGVGKDSERTDLSAPATPGLHGSDLQQGDVQMLTEGQRIAPIRNQSPAATSRRRGRTAGPIKPRGGPQNDLPDPVDFLSERLAGTYASPGTTITPRPTVDVQTFLPLLRRISNSPGSSGVVGQAYLTLFANAMNRPFVYETPLIDMQDADNDLAALLGG